MVVNSPNIGILVEEVSAMQEEFEVISTPSLATNLNLSQEVIPAYSYVRNLVTFILKNANMRMITLA